MAIPAATDATAPRPSPYAPFRHGYFTFYQLARVFLILGGQMVILALGYHVYAITDSKLNLGMIGLSAFLANALLSLFEGHVADRLNRRGIIMVCALASAATIGLLAWEALTPAPSLTPF